jgi:hypothetical protein
MSFVKINGKTIHTSQLTNGITTISGTSSGTYTLSALNINGGSTHTLSVGITGSNYYNIHSLSSGCNTFNITQKAKFFIMGEEVTIEDSYNDTFSGMIIATLNVLGWTYYEQLKKNNTHFNMKLEDVLDKMYLVYQRSLKIEEVLKS